jgi:hypothetical protein
MEDSPAEMHDGFVLRKPKFDLPLSNEALDPRLQQDLLICHLFANNRHSIAEIARRFSLDARSIIEILLCQQVVWDRRGWPNLAA